MKLVKGSATVEAAYAVPAIFLLVVLIINTVFYYHDKNVLIGAAAETAVLGAQLERRKDAVKDTDLSAFFAERTKGKLILFSAPAVSINKTETRIEIVAAVSRKHMKIQVQQSTAVLKPEREIRLSKQIRNQ